MLHLADSLFCVAHDPIDRRCRVPNYTLNLGLAGALLGEQLLFRTARLQHGRLRALYAPPPTDALAHTIKDQIAAEPAVLPVRDWLRYLARDAYDHVAQRLIRAGHLRPRTLRRFLRPSTVVYDPTNIAVVDGPEAHLAITVRRRKSLQLPDTILAGLVLATGLDTYVLDDATHKDRDHLNDLLNRLPAAHRALIDETDAAIGDAVLNNRT